ncbi:MAG: hypothetical protein ACRENY_04240 [Candidatus Dormibacteria bacterium]
MAVSDWTFELSLAQSVLARYSRLLHAAAGDGHHVVSPLGAWMVVAMCGGLGATDAVARSDLAGVLGADPMAAADFAATLLARPHPLVAAAAGLWVRARFDTAGVRQWSARLPEQVDTGDIPSQEELDRWATDRTLGLIRQFPLAVTDEVTCAIASALATKVSWKVPFEVVDAAELGSSRWSASLSRVLTTPEDPRHRQFLTDTPGAGPVAVHLGSARGGLLVGSVIASDPAVPPGQVLAEAERIVAAEAVGPGSVPRLSLFKLPLGAGPVWDIAKERGESQGPHDAQERFTTIMPAWSASTELDLAAPDDLGFPAAAAAIARAQGLEDWEFLARQSSVARYDAVGFQAAAVTALMTLLSGHQPRSHRAILRRATITFRHPYAVVAATFNDWQEPSPAAWQGLPVFSAWVAEAEDA